MWTKQSLAVGRGNKAKALPSLNHFTVRGTRQFVSCRLVAVGGRDAYCDSEVADCAPTAGSTKKGTSVSQV